MKKSAKEANQLKKKTEEEAVELSAKAEKLKEALDKLQEEYDELEDDSIKSNDNIVENLRAQAKIFVSKLKVHLLHPDNYTAGGRIVFCCDLLSESEGPYFEDEVDLGGVSKAVPEVETNDAEKDALEVGDDDSEKTPLV
ncbi:hypothetical protein PIB30_011486 [Stylosanthes scabra]|uniref:Uncharacterized protein n=1 Tax=Stylosanthes scabra TaxID=79078 RepID=A0ABU6S5E8_9FABA|nr:hypothetical protein [Stylosanthes scabra]